MASKRQQRLKQKRQANRQRQKARREELGFNNFETIQKKSVLDNFYAKYEEDYEKARKQNEQYGYGMAHGKWSKFEFMSEMMQEGDYQSGKNKKASLKKTYNEVIDIAQYENSLKQDTAVWNRLKKLGINKNLTFNQFRAQGKNNIYFELRDEEIDKRIAARMNELGRELTKRELSQLKSMVIAEFSVEWFNS